MPRRTLDRADDGLLRLDRLALGRAGTLFGVGDVLLHLPQALLAGVFLRFQPLEAPRLRRPLFGRPGPLINLPQALLSLRQGTLLRCAFLLESSLGALKVDR